MPEVALEAVLLRPGNDRFNVSEALDQLHPFSLVERLSAEENDHVLVGVPLAASIYGRVKLEASVFRVSIEEDRKLLIEFGPGRGTMAKQGILPRIVNLYKTVAYRAQRNPDLFEQYKPILEFLAQAVPIAFLRLSDLEWEFDDTTQAKSQAKEYLRRYLEVAPESSKGAVWLTLAGRCRSSEDATGEIHALCEAALLSSSKAEDLGRYAHRLNGRIRELKAERIEEAWSPEVRDLLHRVIGKMENCLEEMDSYGLLSTVLVASKRRQ